MTLQVYTARITSRDPDRFDITRKSGGAAGAPFAPSWAILGPALNARREAQALGAQSYDCDHEAEQALGDAQEIESQAWDAYMPAYLAEMRVSYRENRAAWDALLARPRVVLVCYCNHARRCHRFLLAEHILPKLGAVGRGETV